RRREGHWRWSLTGRFCSGDDDEATRGGDFSGNKVTAGGCGCGLDPKDGKHSSEY
ncbi:hypothetical protein M8C21_011906, partial [Ambrosia artemisiifolia]